MKKQGKKNQIKSKWYYIFWGIATVSVVAGQIYVGSGYRSLSNSVNYLLEVVEWRKLFWQQQEHLCLPLLPWHTRSIDHTIHIIITIGCPLIGIIIVIRIKDTAIIISTPMGERVLGIMAQDSCIVPLSLTLNTTSTDYEIFENPSSLSWW